MSRKGGSHTALHKPLHLNPEGWVCRPHAGAHLHSCGDLALHLRHVWLLLLIANLQVTDELHLKKVYSLSKVQLPWPSSHLKEGKGNQKNFLYSFMWKSLGLFIRTLKIFWPL